MITSAKISEHISKRQSDTMMSSPAFPMPSVATVLKPLLVSLPVLFLLFNTVNSLNGQQIEFKESNWSYRIPDTKSSIPKSTLTLPLSDKKPDDLKIGSFGSTSKIRYGQFQFGSSNSPFIGFALVENEHGAKLYLDQNRDRTISASEKAASGIRYGTWLIELESKFLSTNKTSQSDLKRTVLFRKSKFGETISFGTLGFMEGKIEVPFSSSKNHTNLSLRIYDSNVNGRFGDADDLVLCDKNQNKKFDPLLEQSTMFRGISFGGRFYVLQSNVSGTSFSATLQNGMGKLSFQQAKNWQIQFCDLLLVSRKGIAIPVKIAEKNNPISLPAGKYRIASLTLSLKDPKKEEDWNYQFAGLSKQNAANWFEIKVNKKSLVPILGNGQFKSRSRDHKVAQNSNLEISPILTTESGLYLTNCWRGKTRFSFNDSENGATIYYVSTEGKSIRQGGSGFK